MAFTSLRLETHNWEILSSSLVDLTPTTNVIKD
jgi:hypothetical protein